MNGQSTCALADHALSWHSIDWVKAYSVVKRMQARIVKATKEGRWNKVKALQRLLTCSFHGKALVSMTLYGRLPFCEGFSCA
ncbi:reverse transcriptase N-terminal domain-containing protein [Paraburkholderia sediminicola]|uniref:reverse transcriptase N-terminal domain-containing protein n=1 Tax=Paraburkholderia sediminicola TaxID=458836 RepID=UPI0038BE0BE0